LTYFSRLGPPAHLPAIFVAREREQEQRSMRHWATGSTALVNRFGMPSIRTNNITGKANLHRGEQIDELPVGGIWLMDQFTLHIGFGKALTGDVDTTRYMRLADAEPPPQPADPNYKEAFKLPVVVKLNGEMIVAVWFCNADLSQDAAVDRYEHFRFAPEARRGWIPYYRYDGGIETYLKARDATYWPPGHTLGGWSPRNASLLGAPLITLPDPVHVPETIEAPTNRPSLPPSRNPEIDQVHQERLSQSRQSSAKRSADPRYNATHAADTKASTKVSSKAEQPGFSQLLDDEIPW
jgi:hypothetical protein